jgi:hypothetical protein
MAKFHINPETGNANVCTAKVKCKFTSDEGVEPPHYATKLDAQKAAEEQLSSTLPTIPSLKNTVEIKEPVGDPRGAGAIGQDIRDLTAKEADLLVMYRANLGRFQSALVDYDVIDKRTGSADTPELNQAYRQADQVIRQAADTREKLLRTRAQLAEDNLIRDQKLHPDRAKERSAVLDALNPQTRQGKEALAKMKQAFEDSEKELAESRRATDNLVSRHENGLEDGANSTRSAFADVNDRLEQSERMTKHARALKALANYTSEYEGYEALHWRGRVNMDRLHSSREETKAANEYSQSQITTYTRIVQGQDQNVLNKRYIATLEKRRTKLPKGESDERSHVNQQLRDLRSGVKYNSAQYENSIGSTYENSYKGFLKL